MAPESRRMRTLSLQLCLVGVAIVGARACTPGENTNPPSPAPAGTLPQMLAFQFDVPASGALSTTLSGFGANECNSVTVSEDARLGDLALLVTPYNNGNCWADPRYAHSDYFIEKGTIAGSDGTCVEAYRVNPHATTATQFKASDSKVYMIVPNGYKVFTLSDSNIAEVGPQTNVVDGMIDTGIVASTLGSSVVVFVAPGDQRFSAFPMVSDTVAGAWISGSEERFSLQARRFPVGQATPHDPSVHWTYGPGESSHTYQKPKEFVPVSRADSSEGVVWADVTTGEVHMTWFSADLLSSESTKILTPASSDDQLYAATSNGQNSIVLITAESQENPPSPTTPGNVRVVKVDSTTGVEIKRANLDTGSSALNFWTKFSSAASAVWDSETDTIAVMFSRRMTQASDGYNHQGCITFLLDGTSLEVKRNLGQTSSHSWSNTILLRSDSDFLGLDLGDNYPRGVNVHRIGQTSKQSKVVYTFKTRHSTGCTGDDVYYVDGDTSYCKRSNDNKVYTEIGHPGIVEVDDGFLVFFAGEQPPLDNTKIGNNVNAPRDIGFVKVSKDLQTVLSSGDAETGGFYNFGGVWTPQANEGINFLTASSSMDESVSRLKTFKLSANRILLSFEVWTQYDFVRTEFMVVDASGGVVADKWHVCFPMRLAIADDGALINGKAVAYAGAPGGIVVRYEICADTSCSGPGGGAMPSLLDDGCPAPAPSPTPTTVTTTATTMTSTVAATTMAATTTTTRVTSTTGFLAPTPAPEPQLQIIQASACDGDDCSSRATCPADTSVIGCTSEPANGGDGLQISTTTCTARGMGGRRRRRANPISAVAVCSPSQGTSVAVSDEIYRDRTVVSASCSSGDALTCSCHSPWGNSVCGGSTSFSPLGSLCSKSIGKSSGRRRGKDGGAGAKVYALCTRGRPTSLVKVIWGASCSGDDCSSVSECPSGTSVVQCASLPANAGDGIQVSSTKCTARGSSNGNSIRAVAMCATSRTTSVDVSGSIYLDNQEVTASCSSGRVLSCYCHSSWVACGSTTVFAPSGSTCKKTVGSSSGHRRRGVASGAGAKIYALCEA